MGSEKMSGVGLTCGLALRFVENIVRLGIWLKERENEEEKCVNV